MVRDSECSRIIKSLLNVKSTYHSGMDPEVLDRVKFKRDKTSCNGTPRKRTFVIASSAKGQTLKK